MSVVVTVRNVPESARNELAARAARGGQSLQEYLRILLIDAAAHPLVDDVIARARARVSSSGSVVSAADTLTARDADRR